MSVEFASIPEPTDDPASMLEAIQALKQVVEALVGRRGTDESTAVTRQDLVDSANLAYVDKPLARSNLGLTSTATLPSSTWFQVANNLSEGSAATMRSTLGLAYGKQTIWVPAGSMSPISAAVGSITLANGYIVPTLDFDQSTDESANWSVTMPKSWDGGNITCTAYWTASAGSGTATFTIGVYPVSNDDTLTGSNVTAAQLDDTLLATADLHISPSGTLAVSLGSPSANDLLMFNIFRDVSEDTLNADARLIGVRLEYVVNAGNDN